MDYLFITCAGLLGFFSISLLTKKNKPLSERIFSVWIVILLFTVLSFVLHVKSMYGHFPIFMTIVCDSHVAHGALLLLYVRAFTDSAFRLRRKHLLHAIPLLLLIGFKLVLNFVAGELTCYTDGACSTEEDNLWVNVTYVYKYIVLGAYIGLTWKVVQQYRQRAKTPREQMRYSWVRQITMGVFFLYCGILLIQLGRMLMPDLFWERMLLGNILTTLFIFIFLYIGNSYAYIFVSPSRKRFVNLSESFDADRCVKETVTERTKTLFERMNRLMMEEELFTRGQLTIKDVATKLGESESLIRTTINSNAGKNFNDYVNAFRVEKLKKILRDPANRKFKILSLAHDCGFTSKSSLLRVFKAQTGKTPSQFQDEVMPD